MGGIHATMCWNESLERVDVEVTGEAEEVWPEVLGDARRGAFVTIAKGVVIIVGVAVTIGIEIEIIADAVPVLVITQCAVGNLGAELLRSRLGIP